MGRQARNRAEQEMMEMYGDAGGVLSAGANGRMSRKQVQATMDGMYAGSASTLQAAMGGKLTRQVCARLTAIVYKYADTKKVAGMFEASAASLQGGIMGRQARQQVQAIIAPMAQSSAVLAAALRGTLSRRNVSGRLASYIMTTEDIRESVAEARQHFLRHLDQDKQALLSKHGFSSNNYLLDRSES